MSVRLGEEIQEMLRWGDHKLTGAPPSNGKRLPTPTGSQTSASNRTVRRQRLDGKEKLSESSFKIANYPKPLFPGGWEKFSSPYPALGKSPRSDERAPPRYRIPSSRLIMRGTADTGGSGLGAHDLVSGPLWRRGIGHIRVQRTAGELLRRGRLKRDGGLPDGGRWRSCSADAKLIVSL